MITLITVLFHHFLEGFEEKHTKFSQDSRCDSQDTNQKPPKYKSEALILEHLLLGS
jgi:hypothetical protein